MKGRNKISIFNRLVSVIPFNLLSRKNLYSLLLCSSVPLLFGSPSVASVTVKQQIAQVTTTGTINRPSLKVGSTGEAVSELQAALKLMGFYNGTVDGTYGQTTATAVSQFKQSAGLAPDGIVDAATWQQLFPGGQTVTANAEQISSTPTNTNNFPKPSQTAANLPKPVVTSNQESRTTTTTRVNTGNAQQLETVRTTSTTRTTNNNNSRQTTRTTTNVNSTNNSTNNRRRNTTDTSSTNTNRSNVSSTSTNNRRRTAANTTSTNNTGNRSRRSTANDSSTYRTRQTDSNLQKPGIQYTAGGFPILRLGMRGEEVYDLQTRLQRLGYLKNNPDGDFGADTEAALKALQQRAGLQPDGVAGGETWEILTRRRTGRSQS